MTSDETSCFHRFGGDAGTMETLLRLLFHVADVAVALAASLFAAAGQLSIQLCR
jgi:hypothetical protein